MCTAKNRSVSGEERGLFAHFARVLEKFWAPPRILLQNLNPSDKLSTSGLNLSLMNIKYFSLLFSALTQYVYFDHNSSHLNLS
jgi:hypothetical protein